MRRNLDLFAAVAATFFAARAWVDAAPAAQQKIASVQYLVGTWNCAHTVGTFSGTYTTTYAKALGDLWLKQTYDFPPTQTAESEPAVHAEYFPEAPGSDATFTKKSDSEYAVDGPSYEQNGTRVTEHHVCRKVSVQAETVGQGCVSMTPRWRRYHGTLIWVNSRPNGKNRLTVSVNRNNFAASQSLEFALWRVALVAPSRDGAQVSEIVS